VGSLGVAHALGQDLGVLAGSILGGLRAAALECDTVTLVLETLRSNETLDLGGLGVWLCALLLWLHLTANDELANLQHNTVSLKTFTHKTSQTQPAA